MNHVLKSIRLPHLIFYPHLQTVSSPDYNTCSADNTVPSPHRTHTRDSGTIQRTNRRCQTAGFADRITPRIITIFYHLRTIRVNQRNHIALQVVDFYHSAYKRLYMPFRGIKWSSLFWQKKEKTFDFSKVFILVEVTGFEPATFWSRTKRATKLRYTSKMEPMKGLEPLTCGLRNRCSTD